MLGRTNHLLDLVRSVGGVLDFCHLEHVGLHPADDGSDLMEIQVHAS